jgi:hypothetical protein
MSVLASSISVILFAQVPTPALCIWSSLPSGSSNCSNESCGAFCNITSYGPTVTECYSGGYPSPGCCICTWITHTCSCVLGSGTGRTAASTFYNGAYCQAPTPPSTKYNCYNPESGKPLPIPIPGVTPGTGND